MKIVSWNVNGLRAIHKKGHFLSFVHKYKPDIICLQETKAERGQAEIDLPEYEEYWNSAKRKGYSGTAIFSNVKPLSINFDIPVEITAKHKLMADKYGDPNSEGRVLTLEFKDFFLTTVYTPNAKGDLSRLDLRHKHWDPAFLEYCETLQTKKPVIFCGDLNVAHRPIDLARPEENIGEHGFTDEEREGVDKIIGSGFVDIYRIFHQEGGKYTWWSNWSNSRARNVGWRIDYFFVSNEIKGRIRNAEILDQVLGSDHCPVMIETDLKVD